MTDGLTVIVGGLLSNVQSDPDPARQAKVKRRIAQYISKAEELGKVFYFAYFLFSIIYYLYNLLHFFIKLIFIFSEKRRRNEN